VLRGPTRAPRIGPPPIPSLFIQAPAPQPPTSQAVVCGSVLAHYEFIHVIPPRSTLYTLPFRLADIIDPATLPLSESATSELSMKLCVPRKSFEQVIDPLIFLPAAFLH